MNGPPPIPRFNLLFNLGAASIYNSQPAGLLRGQQPETRRIGTYLPRTQQARAAIVGARVQTVFPGTRTFSWRKA